MEARLQRRRDWPSTPKPAVYGTLKRADITLASEVASAGVEGGVLSAQGGIVPPIAAAVLAELRRAGVAAVLERYRLDPTPAPAVC